MAADLSQLKVFVLAQDFETFFYSYSQKQIIKLLIGTAHLPCFG
jgi:hypothetical protein